MLVGGGLGNAVLFSIGQALRAAGSKVLYFAGYKKMIDRYKVAEIENAADVVIWCCDEHPGFAPSRPQDRSFVGNIVQAMEAYASGALGVQTIAFADTDRIIAIGSDSMMAAVAAARHQVLQPYLKPHHFAIGSINSPMQCMMKEICAQCLQAQIDPETGKTTYVFSCFNQDQPLDRVDFPGLKARLRQNSVQEKLTAQWIDRCLIHLQLRNSRSSIGQPLLPASADLFVCRIISLNMAKCAGIENQLPEPNCFRRYEEQCKGESCINNTNAVCANSQLMICHERAQIPLNTWRWRRSSLRFLDFLRSRYGISISGGILPPAGTSWKAVQSRAQIRSACTMPPMRADRPC